MCRLVLDSGFVLDLEKTFYIPSFTRNLISHSWFVSLGYSFEFYETFFLLFYKSSLIGNDILCDGLFQILLQSNASYNVMHDQENVGIKSSVMNENFSMLWHRRLGHISIKRIEKLVKDGILVCLDFTNFQTCVDCIKGKHTNKIKKGAK